ncbi:MAG TPA: hypothetical protein DCL63_03685 [Firmicutes bacterium]|nr:hypothetical protein [Bacillota bacterium]
MLLEPYFESADDDGHLVFAFSSAGAFLSALLSAGTAFRVQSPAWLRRRLLAAAGMTDLSLSQMMGMTGIGFHFIVHEECCPLAHDSANPGVSRPGDRSNTVGGGYRGVRGGVRV